MGFIAPAITASQVATAAGVVSAATSVAAARQASAAGKYNQQVQERNATIAEKEGERIEQQAEFDIARFEDQFRQLQGQTTTRILFSNADLSGTGLRILRQNAEQAEIEKDIIDYNAKIGKQKKFEEAQFSRIQGQVARNQAKAQEIGYYAQAGTSLLRTFGG